MNRKSFLLMTGWVFILFFFCFAGKANAECCTVLGGCGVGCFKGSELDNKCIGTTGKRCRCCHLALCGGSKFRCGDDCSESSCFGCGKLFGGDCEGGGTDGCTLDTSSDCPTYTEVMRVQCPSPAGEVRIAGTKGGPSSLKIQKSDGAYGIEVVPVGGTNASCVHIQMPKAGGGSEEKVLRKCGGTAPDCE